MSSENTSVKKLIDQFNVRSTRFVFLIFSLISMVVLVAFFLFLENNRTRNNERITSIAETKIQLLEKNNLLESEIINSFNKSLLYHQTGKETDRFQTIYSLKNTKNIFDEFNENIALFDVDGELKDEITSLRASLVNYDLLIAEAVNTDDKFNELVSQLEAQEDTVSQFIFESDLLGMEASEARSIESLLSDIQTGLFAINNQISIIVNQKIDSINSERLSITYIILILIFFILLAIFSTYILNRTKTSVNSLSKVLNVIAKGEVPDINMKSEKEFQPILNAGNEIVRYLNTASQFAKHIGEGNFGFEFEPQSEQDDLGNSLIDMRDRLQEVTREDKIRNWTNEGQAKFGEILRQYNDNLQELGSNLINNLVEYLKANQGALFILKEEGDHKHLELLSAYAFNRKKFVEKKLEIGEGLAGQAFDEGKTIYLKDIRTDHYNIVTGLGESKPTSLLIVPLKEENKIEGIIEIASFDEIKPHEIEFIESIGESIASSLSSGKVNETTKKLLNETQEKAEEMKAQEEELRQNMEELAATQEQMERRNKELEDIQNQFDQERYLLNALLNSTNDRIYFKDMESKFVRVSKSMIDLFEKQEESEVQGKSDFDFGFEEHAKVAYEDEQRIINTGRSLEDVVEKEQWDDGRVTWVSTTKNPLRDLDGKTVGTFGISRDVTKSKMTELEMQKRKEWLESFFKFETIGFIVLDQFGKVGFATQGILSSLGKGDIDNLNFGDLFIDQSFEEFLTAINYDHVKDEKVEVELSLNNEEKTSGSFMVISGNNENEDGTRNIFVIQK